jgi:hypothetical protein
LVVAFSRAAVGDGFASFFLCNFDLTTGNYGASEGSSEEVDALISASPEKENTS